MSVSFNRIHRGRRYSRPGLAELWGYASYHALARGVVTPKSDNKIILFVTRDKPDYIEQYQDELVGGELRWEGPTDHFAEERVINHVLRGDEIHVFYRERDHTDFTYEGEFEVVDYRLFGDRPSKFVLERKP
jgi:hypothetical protein